MRGFKIGLVASCIAMSVFFQKSGHAIDNTAIWQGVDFDFSQPGARSRGIGSAFVGAADDATAAVTNPAGLVQLPEMQISLEGRTIAKESSDVGWGGNTNGSIRNEDRTDVSFFCFSTPVKLYNDLSINTAIFYNKLSSLGTNIDLSKFPDKVKIEGFGVNAIFPEYSSKIDLALDEFGTSFGLGLLDGKLMLGAGISVLYLNVESEYGQSSPIIAPRHAQTPTFREMQEKVDVNDDDFDFAFRGGLLYSPVKKLTVGASARFMPDMEYETNYHIISDTYFNTAGQLDATVLDDEILQKLKVPDVYSLGLSYRITDKFTFFAEGKYIAYSDMMDDFDAIWRSPFAYGGKVRGRYDINDIIEPHIGAEYVFMLKDTTPLAFRCGSYYEPAHGLEFDASLTDPSVESVEVAKALENLMDGGEDLWHVTIGLGTVIKNKYQIDAAADLTEGAAKNTFILSTAYIF
ncbi:MAG TPA: OmpP1/FadL family transporter [Candidatus Wunengus sp. YC63]|uniref:OmpP1/FadL family transporter n=1 Tax=Candidatus Wunengus sp. YC63 TaxID=3367699 RepID=UPI0040257B35